MQVASLKELYSGVTDRLSVVCVVPVIRYEFKQTDYLYLLYKDLIESSPVKVQSLSVFEHYKLIFISLIKRSAILHYHWLEFQDMKSLAAMPFKLFCIWVFCLFNGKLVWTVHNLIPHDKKYLKLHHRIHKWMSAKAKIVHVHSSEAAEEVSEYYEVPGHKIRVLEHPAFSADNRPKEQSKEMVLEHFGLQGHTINSPVFLVFGGLSEYKGIPSLISLMKEMDSEFTFIIAGYVKKGHEDLHRTIVEDVMDDPRFIYYSGFVSEKTYPWLFSCADICPFNYDAILTSGGVEMARAYNKTIIAPRLGGIKEYEYEENVSLFNNEEELRELLLKALQNHG